MNSVVKWKLIYITESFTHLHIIFTFTLTNYIYTVQSNESCCTKSARPFYKDDIFGQYHMYEMFGATLLLLLKHCSQRNENKNTLQR